MGYKVTVSETGSMKLGKQKIIDLKDNNVFAKYTDYIVKDGVYASTNKATTPRKTQRGVVVVNRRRRLQGEFYSIMCSKRRLRGVSPVMLRLLEEIRAAQPQKKPK